jgi:hypothetical protein
MAFPVLALLFAVNHSAWGGQSDLSAVARKAKAEACPPNGFRAKIVVGMAQARFFCRPAAVE